MTELRRYLASLLTSAVLVAAPAWGEEPTSSSDPIERLQGLGLRLDRARNVSAVERAERVSSLASSLEEIWNDLPREHRLGAHYLRAELKLETGASMDARAEFQRVEKSGRKGAFADDAAYGAVRALELAGRDEEARREWEKWHDRYSDSPLKSEAQVAQMWNAVRLDSLRIATSLLMEIRETAPWLAGDDRVVLAGATLAYLSDSPEDALAQLEGAKASAEADYLKALCHEKSGSMLEAAAAYQNVVVRYPQSSLADPSRLAKADVFYHSQVYQSAAEEYERVATDAARADVRAEALLRRAVCVYFDGRIEEGLELLAQLRDPSLPAHVRARAQYLLGDVLYAERHFEDAIVEYNRFLSQYFEHALAARAQYRVGRSLDALERSGDATGAYQAVVSGYSQSPEAPAAAYLAGVGLLESGRHLASAPYFQLVLDRYALENRDGGFDFGSPEHQELVEASLCLLQLAYHRAGDLAQLSGVPHLMLQRMPRSDTHWRAWALLIDADALASQARYEEAQVALEELMAEFADESVAVFANRLLAWTYARQGKEELAIATEERMLPQYESLGGDHLRTAVLRKAHIQFNEKNYAAAAGTYESYAQQFPEGPDHLLALYQAGLCHQRLGNTGSAVDHWESLFSIDPGAELAEKALVRTADVYFQAEHYDEAKRCFQTLIDHFGTSNVAARATLRIAQCDYNAGRDADALASFSEVQRAYPGTPYAEEAERGLEQALYRLGQQADGPEVLAELVEQFPTSSFAADAQFEIAMRKYEAEDYVGAAEAFRRVVTQFTSYAAVDRAQYLLGDAYARAGQAEEARKAYEQFLFFFPNSEFLVPVQFALGSSRFESGDYLRAAIDFQTVADSETSAETHQAALYNLALCHVLLEKPDRAQQAFDRFREGATSGDSRNADVAYRLGDLYDRTGRLESAVASYELALSGGAGKSLATEIHYRIGTCRERLDDDEGAIAAFRKAASSKDRKDAYRLSAVAKLAAIHEERGEFDEAKAAYRKLMKDTQDQELADAAKARVAQLESMGR